MDSYNKEAVHQFHRSSSSSANSSSTENSHYKAELKHVHKLNTYYTKGLQTRLTLPLVNPQCQTFLSPILLQSVSHSDDSLPTELITTSQAKNTITFVWFKLLDLMNLHLPPTAVVWLMLLCHYFLFNDDICNNILRIYIFFFIPFLKPHIGDKTEFASYISLPNTKENITSITRTAIIFISVVMLKLSLCSVWNTLSPFSDSSKISQNLTIFCHILNQLYNILIAYIVIFSKQFSRLYSFHDQRNRIFLRMFQHSHFYLQKTRSLLNSTYVIIRPKQEKNCDRKPFSKYFSAVDPSIITASHNNVSFANTVNPTQNQSNNNMHNSIQHSVTCKPAAHILRIILFSLLLPTLVPAFNLDTSDVVTHTGEPGSQFGFSVAQHKDLDGTW